jgi:hypothetical protein
MSRFLAHLDSLDPRWLYLTLALVVALPLFVDVRLPIKMSQEAQGFYDAIDRLPPGSVVLLQSDWDAGTLGELKGQFTAVMDHVLAKNLHVAVYSCIPQGPAFADQVAFDLARRRHKVYGKDWVELGYRIPTSAIAQGIQAMSKDFRSMAPEEMYNKTSVRDIPWLADVTNFGDVDLIISIGYGAYLEYIQFGYEVYGTPYVIGVASISTTNMYPLLDAGQLKGMLVGARGGAEYESKMGLPDQYAYATKVIKSQSWAHLLLILGTVIGNIGFYARQRLKARGAE